MLRIHPYGPAETKENPIDAALSESTWVGIVMDETPSAYPDPSARPDAPTVGVPGRHRDAHLAAIDDHLVRALVMLLDDPESKSFPADLLRRRRVEAAYEGA
ncbi:hypothetical protein GCM10017774_68770 [Lentzea cavernae]|uniref:Uncharacterized protein n=1 Tax=Lentzea cavernae TaxID=2020703 RepID=A0ABQ3MPY2_9PSEU|nr:hypothetical protein GCM10017774_68770 [Lentzea cavernae]